MKYTRDISKERNNKEVILYDKKKKERERDQLKTLCTLQKKIKITPKSNLFPSKVGGMNYPLEEHVILC